MKTDNLTHAIRNSEHITNIFALKTMEKHKHGLEL